MCSLGACRGRGGGSRIVGCRMWCRWGVFPPEMLEALIAGDRDPVVVAELAQRRLRSRF